MSETEAVLFANEVFYRAFAARDMKALREIWADIPGVTCTHPGWNPLIGRVAVLESFRAILEGPNPPAVRCLAAQAFVTGASAYVLCHEEINGNYLTATNLFVRVERHWRMVHHHAGPAGGPPQTIEAAPQSIN